MKIIIALDQSEYAAQVLETVSHRRWHRDTSFKLMTVLEPMPFEWEQVHSPTWRKTAQELFDKRNHDAKQMLASARNALLSTLPDCSVHTEIRHGSAREEILEAAVEWSADKIVIGAHGHSPNGLFLGFVPRSVANHASCSVELVRLTEIDATPATRANTTCGTMAHVSD